MGKTDRKKGQVLLAFSKTLQSISGKSREAHDHLIMPIGANLNESLVETLVSALDNRTERVLGLSVDGGRIKVYAGFVFEFYSFGGLQTLLGSGVGGLFLDLLGEGFWGWRGCQQCANRNE